VHEDDVEIDLSRITCPATVVSGGLDLAWFLAVADHLVAELPRAVQIDLPLGRSPSQPRAPDRHDAADPPVPPVFDLTHRSTKASRKPNVYRERRRSAVVRGRSCPLDPSGLWVPKSGATTDRPGLKAALACARDGDVIVVHTLDRLGRTVRDTLNLIHELAERGVGIRNLADPIKVNSTNPADPMAQLAVVLLALFGQMERTYTAQCSGPCHQGQGKALVDESVALRSVAMRASWAR